MGSRTQEQRAVTGHFFKEPVIPVGHHLYVFGRDLVGHGEHFLIGVAEDYRSVVSPRCAGGFGRRQDIEKTMDFRDGRVGELG